MRDRPTPVVSRFNDDTEARESNRPTPRHSVRMELAVPGSRGKTILGETAKALTTSLVHSAIEH